MMPVCPTCSTPLVRVRNDSALNDEQFDSVKAGDWYCPQCRDDTKRSGHRYFWDRDVVPPTPPPEVVHGVCWLLLHGGRVLLEQCAKKAKVLGVGEWFVPGGKLEPGETAEQALRREIKEEWPSVELLGHVALPILEGSAVPPGPRGLFLMRPYVVMVRGELPPDSADGPPLRWFHVMDALQSPVPQVRMMVAAAATVTPADVLAAEYRMRREYYAEDLD